MRDAFVYRNINSQAGLASWIGSPMTTPEPTTLERLRTTYDNYNAAEAAYSELPDSEQGGTNYENREDTQLDVVGILGEVIADLLPALESLHQQALGWTDGMVDDLFGAMQCSEVDALAEVLIAIGDRPIAEAIISAHAKNDEPGDSHVDGGDLL